MIKDEIIRRFCNLSDLVNAKHFNYDVASDCFCGDNPISKEDTLTFSFDKQVIEYIEEAVQYYLQK